MHREISAEWLPAPVSPALENGQIDVWRLDLSAADLSLQRARAHDAMYQILAAYLDRAPAEIEIDRPPQGKPRIRRPATALEFNLSHTRDSALLAVSREHAVGVDIETHRHIQDPLRLARRLFSSTDIAQLEILPESRRLDAFLDLWTRLEARQKTLGRGVFASPVAPTRLSSFSFCPQPRAFASLSTTNPDDAPRIRFFQFA